jgi:uroporphyrinogen decarboxylase
LRGLEQALIDLAEGSEILTAALDHIFNYHYEVARRAFVIGKGKIELTYIAEDFGGQRGLLMSLGHIRKYFLPKQKQFADLARHFGIHNFYHTDGDIRSVIPDLINITGIELLNPIQWRCPSMERKGLVRDFGRSIIFHGAMDNQQTLPFGSVDDVKQEVLDNIGIFSEARCICAPCHNFQPVTPTENIVAMYETIFEFGKL